MELTNVSHSVYKKLKKQNGEAFAQTLRNYHNGILEIPDILNIVRYAGRDAKPLLPYLMTLLSANDNEPADAHVTPQDPFDLLDEAGYDAFYADTLEKQNSIMGYFKKDELLCTFNDVARYENYHIVHAIKKDVGHIKRQDFEGKEKRQDAYGTSVIFHPDAEVRRVHQHQEPLQSHGTSLRQHFRQQPR